MADAKPLVILGGGMHGRVVLDIAKALGRPIAGFLDDTLDRGSTVDDQRVLGPTDLLANENFIATHSFFVAIGNNIARRRFASQLRARGGDVLALIHENCWISPTATIGSGTVFVGANMVFSGARVGRDVLVDPDTTIGADSLIEDGVYLCPGCHLGAQVTCREECFLGLGAVAIPNTVIGRRAVVGAGAVVIRDVPDGKLAIGNPARVVGDANLDDFSPYPARRRPK
jgi:sugar O-acyltransferase (sialic acid O-acetyltransferase NeuD family)